jgi:hypothetical protein
LPLKIAQVALPLTPAENAEITMNDGILKQAGLAGLEPATGGLENRCSIP